MSTASPQHDLNYYGPVHRINLRSSRSSRRLERAALFKYPGIEFADYNQKFISGLPCPISVAVDGHLNHTSLTGERRSHPSNLPTKPSCLSVRATTQRSCTHPGLMRRSGLAGFQSSLG